MLRYWMMASLAFLLAGGGLAQDQHAPPPGENKEQARLDTLLRGLLAARESLKELVERQAAAATETEKAELAPDIAAERARVAQLRSNFVTIATGIEEGDYLMEGRDAPSWQENLDDIIAPISREVRDMTAGAREMEELRTTLRDWEERKDMAERAVPRLEALLSETRSEGVRSELQEALKLWQDRLTEATSQTEVLQERISKRESETPSTWTAISQALAEFWRTRGLNLLLAISSAALVFVLTRRGYRLVRRLSPFHRGKGYNLAARSLDLAWAAVAVVLAVAMAVLVLYLKGDWLLLALAIIGILGILWASKHMIPPYLEQLRLLLNLGPVRQGERMIFEGVPWRVDRLHFYCEFSNPALSGAILRLPVRDVMPLHSRPAPAKEQWFPTLPDDWVKLDDGTFGKVIQQSQEQVVVLRLGGSLKTYSTSSFLGQNPENISRGFRISAVFGIDYQHQPVCTTEVPDIFLRALESRLTERVGPDNLRSVKVEFASAGASSLDYAILADFDGEVASRFNVLDRLIQKTCVDVCNERGWVIPFTQITVHQA